MSNMENQPLLPVSIRISRDDKEDKAAMSFDDVKNNLKELLPCSVVGSEQPSIYKLPECIREVQAKAFEPRFVSIGPYHHGEQHLVRMEREKLKAFHGFRTRHGLEVESIVDRVGSMLKDLQGSYDQLQDEWKEDPAGKFLQLMIVDGCFMLECFDVDGNCSQWLSNMEGELARDMLLLENQLPMKLLEELYSMTNKKQNQATSSSSPGQKNVKSLVSDFMCFKNKNKLDGKYLHILDMYKADLLQPLVDRKHRSTTGKKSQEEQSEESNPQFQIIPPARQLREAGIKFRKSPTTSFRDVDFEGGVLWLPLMEVDDDTEPALLNVMAFEKLHVGAGGQVSSFIIHMDNLIDTDGDVELLASDGILVNALGDDKSAADLFKLLAKGASMDMDSDSHITQVHQKVHRHCETKWNKWCASLKHNYFQNPWAIISLIAAFVGFLILLLQAVYQLLDYYR